jgi:ketosteroid isomerase-like protein
MPDADLMAVLETFDSLFQALCEDRDARAATALFVDDEDAVMWGSQLEERAVGQRDIGELHRAIAEAPAKVAFHWSDRSVHVEDDVAWVNAAGEVVVEVDQEPPRIGAYRAIAIIVRRAGGWRWHTFHGSEPTP